MHCTSIAKSLIKIKEIFEKFCVFDCDFCTVFLFKLIACFSPENIKISKIKIMDNLDEYVKKRE
eukprot:TRINITY_DN607_c1_g1_i4.p1 TRINITY_DN607_c1_g1~~TRINITY_DN607_c1_g1_i4.p1  ORF type:complete len:64 (+),score=2.74 TRINITY_DN607_c1_g1_i4:739-930(+)